jgi:hypothetical protein
MDIPNQKKTKWGIILSRSSQELPLAPIKLGEMLYVPIL